jgi:hypothetical protein
MTQDRDQSLFPSLLKFFGRTRKHDAANAHDLTSALESRRKLEQRIELALIETISSSPERVKLLGAAINMALVKKVA